MNNSNIKFEPEFEKAKKVIPYLLFLVISFFVMIPFYNHNILNSGSDMQFHLNRINEIYMGLKNGSLFPFISTYSFNNTGTPINLFYPAIFLYPFALIRLIIHNSVFATYIGINIIIFTSMVTCYIVGLRYWHNDCKKSFFFAVFYTLSTNYFLLLFSGFTLGEAIAAIFLPVVIYGAYNILFSDTKKWYFLVVGMTGVMYAHLLSLILDIFVLLIMLILSMAISKQILLRLKFIFISAVLTILNSMFFIYGFVDAITSTKISVTKTVDLFSSTSGVGDFLTSSFNNNSIGIMFTIAMVVAFLNWKNLSVQVKIIFAFAGFFCLITTNIFPWQILQNTPISVIQFPYRFLTIANFYLALLLTELVFNDDVVNKHNSGYVLCVLYLFCIVLYVSSEFRFFSSTDSEAEVNYHPSIERPINMTRFKVNKADFNNILGFNNGVGSTDYWPVKSVEHFKSISQHKIIVNGKILSKTNLYSYPNKIIYKMTVNREKSTINLPILNYNLTRVLVNGKSVNYYDSNRGTIEVRNIPKGNVKITVKYVFTKVYNIVIWVTLVSILLTIVLIFV